MLRQRLVLIGFNLGEEIEAVVALMEKYADVPRTR
jgi:hypothetical protein